MSDMRPVVSQRYLILQNLDHPLQHASFAAGWNAVYFTTRSASACCRLRRSLSVLSKKSSMWIITTAQEWGAPASWVGGRDVYV